MTNEIKIEKKASEVIQPESVDEARQAIQTKKDLSGANLEDFQLDNLHATGATLRKTNLKKAKPFPWLVDFTKFLQGKRNRCRR